MGKSFELFGLVTFNIFIAIILSTTFLSGSGNKISELNHTNVALFIEEVAAITGGKRDDMDDFTVTEFFLDHVHDSGHFISTIDYSTAADMMNQTKTLEMGKMDFISHILQGLKAMKKHETAVRIEHIKILNAGTEATVTTTNFERGLMPVDDGFGGMQMMPVTGTSYCEQDLVLSQAQTIQMRGASCDTSISFENAY
jgi:hypothetical protein